MAIIGRRATHAQRLERFLGTAQVERISNDFKHWYGPPAPLLGVPGSVWVHGGGDFRGPLASGQFAPLCDYLRDKTRATIKRWAHRQMTQAQMAGFASWSDLLAEATQGGKFQQALFAKGGGTQVSAGVGSFWGVGSQPAAGAAGSAAPGGRAPVRTTTGALAFANAAGGDWLYFVSAFMFHSIGGSIFLYDRIFDVAKTASSTATEAVTGVPTRYQNTTAGTADYIGGNFVFPEVSTVLGATAHNWTVCQYTDQAGNTGNSIPSIAGAASQPANIVDLAVGSWFMPLASGDTGIGALTQMQNSAIVTGAVNFVIGHLLGVMVAPFPLATTAIDGTQGIFQTQRIFDDACLAMLNVMANGTTAPTVSGQIIAVSG